MGRLFIVLIAAAGILWRIDPTWKPYIDAVVWVIGAGVMFYLGDRLERWLARLEAKPYWKRVKAEAPVKARPQRRQRPRYSGASMPLLER